MAAPAPAADHTMEMMMMQQNQQMMMQQQQMAQERADRAAAQERADRAAAQERADRAERQDRMAQQGGGGGGGGMMAPQPQSTVVVMGGGAQPNVKYCGIVTHIISWFFPCICCCPIDERRADEEVYIGIKTIICCLLLCARTPAPNKRVALLVFAPVPNKRVALLVFADRRSLCAVTRGCSASRSTCGRGPRSSPKSSSLAAESRSSRS